MEVINLCGHCINVANEAGDLTQIIPPSGLVARVRTKPDYVGDIDGVPLVQTVLDYAWGLPEPEKNVIYVASYLVAIMVKRSDVVSPDTGPTAIKDEDGEVVAVRNFQRFA
jgi:hypothetical protein